MKYRGAIAFSTIKYSKTQTVPNLKRTLLVSCCGSNCKERYNQLIFRELSSIVMQTFSFVSMRVDQSRMVESVVAVREIFIYFYNIKLLFSFNGFTEKDRRYERNSC